MTIGGNTLSTVPGHLPLRNQYGTQVHSAIPQRLRHSASAKQILDKFDARRVEYRSHPRVTKPNGEWYEHETVFYHLPAGAGILVIGMVQRSGSGERCSSVRTFNNDDQVAGLQPRWLFYQYMVASLETQGKLRDAQMERINA